MRLITEQYYYPDLKKTLEKIGKSCILCAINKPTYGKQLDFGKKVYPNAPRLGWSFDIACGYPSIKGYQYIYLYVDDFSGYSICIPAKTRSSEEILRSLKDNLVKYFGYPNYRVVKRNCQVAKLHCFEHLNENMVENSSPTCKHNLFALIQSKKMFIKCPGM